MGNAVSTVASAVSDIASEVGNAVSAVASALAAAGTFLGLIRSSEIKDNPTMEVIHDHAIGKPPSENIMLAQSSSPAEADKKILEAVAAQKEAEKKWKEGIQPVEWPTLDEFEAAKKRYQYAPGKFHLGIAGASGTGKSSLINALRGITDMEQGSASTDVVECTSMVNRYPDPDRTKPFVWYDVPGAGTISVPKWRYFNDHGLYIFDCLIVVYNDRFSDTDVAILENCRLFNIPSYIVRSKSDVHIANLVKKLPNYDTDDEEHDSSSPGLQLQAREQYIDRTRQNVHNN